MEKLEIAPHASVLSRSALHAFITGPVNQKPLIKNAFNPYRKRQGILALANLEQLEESLEASLQNKSKTQEKPSPIEAARPLTVASLTS